jgi:WD40 repeat protein
VSSARFTDDGRRLLTVDVDRRVALSDATRGTRAGPSARATVPGAAAIAHDGSRLAIGTPSGALRVYAVGGGRGGCTAPPGRSITGVAFDRGGARIVTANDDNTARLWDARALDAPPIVLRGHDGALLSWEFSSDGGLVLTAGVDRTARLWDPLLGTSVLVLRTSKGAQPGSAPTVA